jgi:hypothetical protein
MTYRYALISTALLTLAAPAFAGGPNHGPAYTPDLVPPVSNPGECYARVKVPAQYETATERVVVREAHTKPHVAQAKLVSRTEQVMVKEPSVRYSVRQPTYNTVSEQVLTRPSYDKLSVTPPTFQTVTETIQTSAPRLVWKKGNPGELARQGYVIHSTADAGYRGQGYSSTTQFGQSGGQACGAMCEIWCLVEEPGETVNVTRKVMSHPGGVQRMRVPAVYQTITKQVVADPGGVEEIPVPAEYRSITVEDVAEPGIEALIEVPAEYGDVQTKRLVADERYEWRRVLCAPGTGAIAQPAPTYTPQTHYTPAPAPVTQYHSGQSAHSTGITHYETGQVCRDQGQGCTNHGGLAGHAPARTYSQDGNAAYETGRHWRQRTRRR